MKRHGAYPSVVLLAIALGLAAPASAEDTWTDPFPGVRYLHRVTSGPRVVHAMIVDLHAPGIALTVNRHEHRNMHTGQFGRLHGASAGINGGLCGEGGTLCRSLQRGRYETWPDTSIEGSPATVDSEIHGNLVFGADARSMELIPTERVLLPEEWMSGVLSSKPMVLADGIVTTEFPLEWNVDRLCGTGGRRHPRTSVGLSSDRRHLILAVVDGRSTASIGMSCPELGELMRELGAHWALNLDGGGSSTMWIRGQGIVNTPSDGAPRTVANHLGLFALGADFQAELDSVDSPERLDPSETATVLVRYVNTGSATWEPDQVGLRTTLERDAPSALATDSWLTPSRPARLAATTAPGEIGVFELEVRAPEVERDCNLTQHFGLILERYGPFADVSTWFGPDDDAVAVSIAVGAGGAGEDDCALGSPDAGVGRDSSADPYPDAAPVTDAARASDAPRGADPMTGGCACSLPRHRRGLPWGALSLTALLTVALVRRRSARYSSQCRGRGSNPHVG